MKIFDDSLGQDLYPVGGLALPLTEMSFLQKMLLVDDALFSEYAHIPDEAFVNHARQRIWGFMKLGFRSPNSLHDVLKTADHKSLSEIIFHPENNFNIRVWADQLMDLLAKRKLEALAISLAINARSKKAPANMTIQALSQDLSQIAAINSSINYHRSHSEAIGDLMDEIIDEKSGQKPVRRALWGWADLDLITGGLHAGTVVTIGARPGMGKTTFALCTAANLISQKIPCLFISLEMDNAQLVKKVFSRAKRTSLLPFAKPEEMDMSYLELLANYGDEMAGCGLSYYQGKVTCAEDVLRAYSEIERSGDVTPRVIFVDYLQLMALDADKNGSLAQAIARLTRSLVSLAREKRITIVLLSQLNRSLASRSDKRPILSDLRDSGSIEQDSHAVMFLHRDTLEGDGTVEIVVAKNREGPTGIVPMVFDGEHSDFKSKLGFN